MSGQREKETARALLNRVLPDPEQFVEFLIDCFPNVAKRSGSQTDRLALENKLLLSESPAEILDALERKYPDRYRRYYSKEVGTDELDHDSELGFDETDAIRHVDRIHQFDYLCAFASRKRHEVILVPGCDGEAHHFFLQRIDMAAPTKPTRAVLSVRWSRPDKLGVARNPTIRTEIMAKLAIALGGETENDLPGLFAHRLRSQSLIILHPIIDRYLNDRTIQSYYTEWLPELLYSHRGPHTVHFVQPIAWSPRGWFFHRVARDRRATYRQAEELIRRLKSNQKAWLAIDDVIKLEPIKPKDIIDFLHKIGWPRNGSPVEKQLEREAFTSEVMQGPATSETILHRIKEKLGQ